MYAKRTMKLDKRSPVPLYYQLVEHLRARIRSGDLKPGEKLSSEVELGKRAGISRMTVRQALIYLSREGVLEIKPGVGAFVAEPKLAHDALRLLGFTEEMMARGGTVESEVLEHALVDCPPYAAAGLDLSAGEPVVKIVRVRMVDEVPLLLETSVVPAALCPGLEEEDLAERALYELLERRYGLRLEHARQAFEARAASELEQRLFGVEPGTANILLEGVSYAEQGLPVEYFSAIYRGDRFRFTMDSRRRSTPHEEYGTPRVSIVLIGDSGTQSNIGRA